MNTVKISRNAPCPCGSGKKFKVCCLNKSTDSNVLPFPAADDHSGHSTFAAEAPPGFSTTNAAHEALREAIDGGEFESMEELQALADRVMSQRNARPIDDFDGLSPSQMGVLLDQLPANVADPSFIRFDAPDDVTGVTVMDVLSLLADAIGEKGLKPTGTGNLPRQLCRDIALAHLGEEGYAEHTRYGNINKEPDFDTCLLYTSPSPRD